MGVWLGKALVVRCNSERVARKINGSAGIIFYYPALENLAFLGWVDVATIVH